MADTPYVYDVTQSSYEQLVIENSRHVPVLVDFWADWCGPCKMQLPVLLKLAAEYQGKFLLAKIDVSELYADAYRDGKMRLHDVIESRPAASDPDPLASEGPSTESAIEQALLALPARHQKVIRGRYGIGIHSLMTSAFTRVNHLLHPHLESRQAWSEWFARFADLARLIFDQASLAEGGQLEDPGAFVQRLNRILLGL